MVRLLQVVPLRYDVAFKKAFGQVDVFNAFVRDVLDIEFEVSEVAREFSYHEQVGRVKLKYDLFAEDKERRIIVEIQHVYEADFFDRFLYYHLIGMIEQIHSFHDYRFGKTVYTIVMLTSLPKDAERLFSTLHVRFDCRDEAGQPYPLYPHRLIFLNPTRPDEHVSSNVRLWLDAVRDSLDNEVDLDAYQASPPLQNALLAIQKQTLTSEELAKLKDESAWLRAKQESHEEGRQEGRQEGERNKAIEIAKHLLTQGLSPDAIASATGLSTEDIQTLAASS